MVRKIFVLIVVIISKKYIRENKLSIIYIGEYDNPLADIGKGASKIRSNDLGFLNA